MDGSGGRFNWQAAAVLLSLLMSAISVAFLFGEVRGDIRNSKEDIAQLQADGRNITATLSEIKTSAARIEARLEILLPTSMDRERTR